MILKELLNFVKQGELVSICRDCHEDELTGIVADANEAFVILVGYDNNGDYDGISVFETDQIEEIFWGNREHRAIARLIKKKIEPLKFASKDFSGLIIEANSMYNSLCIFEHHCENSYDIGEIVSHDEEWLKVTNFGTRKTLSRMKKIMKLDSVSRICVDSPYQNKIVELHQQEI